MSVSYDTVTEVPGGGASREQLSMFLTRYRFAARFCEGKDVLEVACGAGQGLGYLARTAQRVVGGDIDEKVLRFAVEHYGERDNIEVKILDAHQLPVEEDTFDVVLIFEAIYYLAQPERFLQECRRVLRRGGLAVIVSVNPEWSDFNPSPYSTYYLSARELAELGETDGFDVETLGAFPATRKGVKGAVISLIKRTAVSMHLMPKTMEGKEFLKRLFYGRLVPLPAEVDDSMGEYHPPVPIECSSSPVTQYKVIYAICRQPEPVPHS